MPLSPLRNESSSPRDFRQLQSCWSQRLDVAIHSGRSWEGGSEAHPYRERLQCLAEHGSVRGCRPFDLWLWQLVRKHLLWSRTGFLGRWLALEHSLGFDRGRWLPECPALLRTECIPTCAHALPWNMQMYICRFWAVSFQWMPLGMQGWASICKLILSWFPSRWARAEGSMGLLLELVLQQQQGPLARRSCVDGLC